MSFKKTLVLAFLLISCLLYVYKVELPKEEAKTNKENPYQKITSADLSSIEIIRPGTSFALLNMPGTLSVNVPDHSDWEISSVKGAKLENSTLNSLIAALSSLKLDTQLPAEDVEKDLSVYGLSDPGMRLKIKRKNNEEREILLGKLSDYLNKRYLKFADDSGVYMISDALFAAAAKSEHDFRDKTPLIVIDKEINKIAITSTQPKIELEKKENVWRINEPLRFAASQKSISEFNRTLRNIKVEDFIDDLTVLPSYQLNPAKFSIELSGDNNKVQKIYFSDIKNGDKKGFYMYVEGQPSIYKLAEEPFSKTFREANWFRIKERMSFPTSMVDKIVIEENTEKPIVLEKKDKLWKVNSKDGDMLFVQEFISNLAGLEAKDFPSVSINEYGFDKPILKVTVSFPETSKVSGKVLTVGKKTTLADKSEGYFAKTNDSEEVFIISSESFKQIALLEEALLPQKTAPPSK